MHYDLGFVECVADSLLVITILLFLLSLGNTDQFGQCRNSLYSKKPNTTPLQTRCDPI